MAENNNTTPQLNLEQILQTLANLPPIPQVSQQEPLQPYDPLSIPVHKRNTQEPYSSIPPAIPAPAGYNQHAQLDPRLIGRSLPQYHQADSKPVPQRSSTPTIDPSTIIEWKHALRCVNKMAAQSPTFEPTIQKMIKSQEQNTKDWENGRQRLIEEQNAKRENEKTQRAALSIPGLLENAPLLRVSSYRSCNNTEAEILGRLLNVMHKSSKTITKRFTGLVD